MPDRISNDRGEVTFENILQNFRAYVQNDGVDAEVMKFYSNMMCARFALQAECAVIAVVQQAALREAYIRRRQLRREEIARSRKFSAQLKCWVQEIKQLDAKRICEIIGDEVPSLTVRILLDGQVKGTARSSPVRNFDGSWQALKINQDVDFYVKRPTSIIHVEVVHIKDDEPEGSPMRELLIGEVKIALKDLESQKMIRQWYKLVRKRASTGELQLRLHYTFKEDEKHGLSKLDSDAWLLRPKEAGEPVFMVGMIGVGQIGQTIAEALIRSPPPRLREYFALAGVCAVNKVCKTRHQQPNVVMREWEPEEHWFPLCKCRYPHGRAV